MNFRVLTPGLLRIQFTTFTTIFPFEKKEAINRRKKQLQPKHLSYFWSTYATFHQYANNKCEALITNVKQNSVSRRGEVSETERPSRKETEITYRDDSQCVFFLHRRGDKTILFWLKTVPRKAWQEGWQGSFREKGRQTVLSWLRLAAVY